MCAAPRPHPLCYCGPSTEAEGVLSGKVRAPQGEQVARLPDYDGQAVS